MIEEAPKNKMDIGASKRKDEAPEKVTVRAVSRIKNEYHFPGSGIFKPLAVVATTIEEATKIWRERRERIQAADEGKQTPEEPNEETRDEEEADEDTSHTEAKVEEPKETNSE